jgi:hypothetical protein
MLKPAKINDVKAPRFRVSKYRHSVLNRDLFDEYKEKFKDSKIDWKAFKGVVEGFNDLYTQEIVTNRDGAKLPGFMGIMALCSFKPKRRVPMNWLSTINTTKQIKDFNLDTNELVCKIVYTNYKSKYKIRWAHIWRFEACRIFKRRASAAFRQDPLKFKRMDNKSIVSKIFKDAYIRTHFKRTRDEQGAERGFEDNGQIHIQ